MRIHILVEGPSEEALLSRWLPRFQPNHKHRIYTHQGKGRLSLDPTHTPALGQRGLLDQLPAKLRAWGREFNSATDRVLVLVDADNEDPGELHRRISSLHQQLNPRPDAEVSVAVEETEAFYLGDSRAIRRAFPTFKKSAYQTYAQDSICGTWEVFQAVIGATTVDKVAWARKMAEELGTDFEGANANRSPSFQNFCRTLRRLAGEEGSFISS